MKLEWKYQKVRKGVLYQLFFYPAMRLEVTDNKGNQVFAGFGDREVFRLNSWLVEVSDREDTCTEVLLKQIGDGPLKISGEGFLKEDETMKLHVRLYRKPIEERTFEKVRSLTIGPEQVQVETADGQKTSADGGKQQAAKESAPPVKKAAAPQAPKKEPASGAGGGTAEQAAPAVKEEPKAGGRRAPGQGGGTDFAAARAVQEAQAARKEAQAAKAQAQAMEQAIAQLRTQLDEAQKRTAGLESAASAHLSDLLQTLGPHREQLGEALRTQLEQAQAAEASLEDLRGQVEAARSRSDGLEKQLSDLRAELEALNKLETIRTLDCGQAQKDLECLRIQLEADGISLELLRQEPFFKEAPLQEQLEDIQSRIEKAETQLGAIVSLRERINGRVQDAILCEGGTIPLNQELGGGEVHGRGRAETQNP